MPEVQGAVTKVLCSKINLNKENYYTTTDCVGAHSLKILPRRLNSGDGPYTPVVIE